MTSNLLLMYGIFLITSLKGFFIFLIVVCFIAMVISAMMFSECAEEHEARVASLFKRGLAGFIVSCLFTAVLPSKQDVMFIVGGAGALTIATDPHVQGTALQALEWVGRQLEAEPKK